MQIILFLLLVIVLVISIYGLNQLKMKKELKIVIVLAVVLTVIGAIYYEMESEDSSRYKRDIINSFQQGKELKCKEYSVDSKDFILNTWTLTFVSKSTKLEGVIIKVEDCKVEGK